MSKFTKKSLSLLCALAMLMVVLTGCGGQTGGTTGGTTGGGGSADGVTDVNFLTWSNEATVVFMKSIAEEFHEQYPQYNLVVTEVPSGEIDSVILNRINAADVDVVSFQTFSKPQEDWNADSVDPPMWQGFIDDGHLTDLTDQAFMQNFNVELLMGNAYKGRIYSLTLGTVGYGGMFYNKDIFKELNIGVPQTWAELMAACETVKAAGYEAITAGGQDQWPLNIFAQSIINANFGADTKDFGRKLLLGELKHTDAQTMIVYNCMEDIARQMDPSVVGIPYSDAPGRFALGNTAMYIDGTWSWRDIQKAGPDFEFGYFACPPVTARTDGLVPQDAIKYDLSLSVPTNAPNQAGGLAFLEFLSQPDVYSRFINAVGLTPTQPDVTMEEPFLNELSEILQKPTLNAEMLLYTPKGVGEFGGNQFSFFYLKALGGEFTAQEFAEAADQDFEDAWAAIERLG